MFSMTSSSQLLPAWYADLDGSEILYSQRLHWFSTPGNERTRHLVLTPAICDVPILRERMQDTDLHTSRHHMAPTGPATN